MTYAGHPLYRYLPDAKPGQTNGQDSHDFGAGWYVLSPAGKKIERSGLDDPGDLGKPAARLGEQRRPPCRRLGGGTERDRGHDRRFACGSCLTSIPTSNRRRRKPCSAFGRPARPPTGVLLAVPEYAFGIPGAFKNALDWTVGSGSLYRKPVTVVDVAPPGRGADVSRWRWSWC